MSSPYSLGSLAGDTCVAYSVKCGAKGTRTACVLVDSALACPQQVLLVSYEALRAAPAREIARIGAFQLRSRARLQAASQMARYGSRVWGEA